MAEPLRVLLAGVSSADLDRLRRLVAADPLIQVAGATTVDARGRPVAVDMPHHAVLMSPEAVARTQGPRERHLSDQTPTEALTARERDVLVYAAEGHGNRDIGQLLGISEHTVKFHLASIYGKLGVGNRTEAVQHALRAGILEI